MSAVHEAYRTMSTTMRRNIRKSATLRKLSINVTQDIGLRLKRLAFDHDVSESSIIEIALREFLAQEPRRGWENTLRQKGATLRRAPE
ncbi:MAG: hypothetical protein NVSMB31_06380 [Vulcanimicrobiaceae bacterium]